MKYLPPPPNKVKLGLICLTLSEFFISYPGMAMLCSMLCQSMLNCITY